jgi:hypothetical protein
MLRSTRSAHAFPAFVIFRPVVAGFAAGPVAVVIIFFGPVVAFVPSLVWDRFVMYC